MAICEGLTKRGHNVTLYAPLGSRLKHGKIESLNLRALANDSREFHQLLASNEKVNHYVPALWEGYMVNNMFNRAEAGDFDILHFHHPEAALSKAAHSNVPVVHTLHDPVYDWYKELFELYASENQHFISISDNQRRDAPDLPYLTTVHNGVDPKDYPFSDKSEDYLLYSGRIIPEKGVKEAVQIAKKTHHRLLIIGPVSPDHEGYFDQYIKPYLDDQILYLGYIEREQLARYYQKAKAVLTPVQWEEPFGLTTIEAMASGTPVISLRRGAAPEIIQDGKTGFVVDSIAEMAEAVYKVGDLDRRTAREHVKKNFSIKKMVDGYEAAYEEVLRNRKKVSRRFMREQIKKMPLRLRETTQKRRLRHILKNTKRLR
jgi:glycosyltransferase involved in cell wall biosynthesis